METTFRDQDRTANAERHVSWVRFVLITFNVAVYYLLLAPSGDFPTIPWLAATISGVAWAYGLVVLLFRPYEHFGVMQSSLWTTGTDMALIVLWILATGAAASPFFVLWSISLVAIGYRFGPRATLNATIVYFILEGAFLAAGGLLLTAAGLIRLAYIVFVGSLMALAASYTVLGMRKHERLGEVVDELAEAKEAADHAHRRIGALLENAPSTILEVDRDGRITYVNRLLEGFTAEQVIGQPASSFIADDQRTRFEEALHTVLHEGRPVALEVQGHGANMAIRDYRSHMGPVKDGQGDTQGAIIITLDVTEEKQQAVAAKEAERRKEQVNRLEEEAEFRHRFINSAAHELNTPMTPLRLQMGILRNILGDSPNEVRAVEIMERNLKRLGHLVTDLLDATKVQAKAIRWNPAMVNLSSLMEDAVETFRHLAVERSIALEVDVDKDIEAFADPQRVGQIIYNLLSNALKFTPTGGRVRCEATVLEDGQVELAVTDTGPGLSEEEIARIFLPFSQVHPSLVPEEPGTGLGLYLSRNLAEAQGGRLDVESPGRGQGATFRLRLPGPGSVVEPEEE